MVWKKVNLKIFYLQQTKDLLYFIFDNILYKQIDRVAMGSPLSPSLTNAVLVHQEQNWLGSFPLELDHHIIDDMLMMYLYFLNHLIT